MVNVWGLISNLGVNHERFGSLENRSIVLANRINFIVLSINIVLSVFLTIMRFVEGHEMTFASIRMYIIIVFCLINMWLAQKGYITFYKVLLIFIPSFVFFVLSTMVGFVEEESYFYYPYVIIALSIIPHLILLYKKHAFVIWVSVAYYLSLVLVIDLLLNHYAQKEFQSKVLIEGFYVYYKIAAFAIFIFINLSIYYLRNINFSFEKKILEYNEELNSTIEELRVTQKHLVQSEKMASLGTLTAGVAHEINNPLNFISGAVNIIEELKETLEFSNSQEVMEEYNAAAGMMRNGIDRVAGIVKALRTFSYTSNESKDEADINSVIENSLLFLKLKLKDDIVVIRDLRLELKVPLYVDKMHQVVLNILDNAIFELDAKLSGEKIIKIETYQERDFAVLRIYNSGDPIPDENIESIFDPFFTTKDPGQGTGLGLSIVYSIIQEHNAFIKAVNKNNGVSFNIKLPLSRSS